MSVGPRLEKFNLVSNNHIRTKSVIFAFQFVKPSLQTITLVTIRYAKISSISIPSYQVMQAIAMFRLYENKPLQNAFEPI